MNESPHVDDLLSAYLDGELDAAARARVETHLQSCALCATALGSWRDIDARLADTQVPDPGPAYWSRFASRVENRLPAARAAAKVPWVERVVGWFAPAERIAWGRVAGAFAVVTLVTYVGMRGFEPGSMPTNGPALSGSSATPAPSEIAKSDGSAPETAEKPAARQSNEAAPRAISEPAADATQRAPEPGAEKAPERRMTNPVREAAPARPADEFAKAPPEAPTAVLRTAPPPVDSLGVAMLDQRFAPGAAAKSESPVAGSATKMSRSAPLRADTDAAAVRAFVAAALAGDADAARRERDNLAASPGDAALVSHMDAWLQSAARDAGASSGTWEGLAALDALVWPRRGESELRPHAEELARRLLEHATDAPRRERAIAYAEWLARTAPDAAGRAIWESALETLR